MVLVDEEEVDGRADGPRDEELRAGVELTQAGLEHTPVIWIILVLLLTSVIYVAE